MRGVQPKVVLHHSRGHDLLLLGVALVLLGVVVVAPEGIAALPSKPSFVIMIADDLGWGDVGYLQNGHAQVRTWNLDDMAKGNNTIQLNRFHTEATCTPSRLAILSGRTPTRDCVRGAPSLGNQGPLWGSTVLNSVAQVAENNGYLTKHMGKFPAARNMNAKAAWPSAVGFSKWIITNGGMTYNTSCFCFDHPERTIAAWKGRCFLGHITSSDQFAEDNEGDDSFKCEFFASNDDGGSRFAYRPPPNQMEAYNLGQEFEAFLGETKTGPTEHPFLAVVAFRAVHVPFIAAPRLINNCTKDRSARSICNIPKPRTKQLLDYAGAVSSIDSAVGYIRRALRRERPQTWENTLVFFLSDNGPEIAKFDGAGSTGGLRGRKRTLFEGGIRTPALLEWPAVIKSNFQSTALVSILDIPATLEYLITGSVDPIRDGVSLVPLIQSPANYTRSRSLFVCEFLNYKDATSGQICPVYVNIDPTGTYKLIAKRTDAKSKQYKNFKSTLGFYRIRNENVALPKGGQVYATMVQEGNAWSNGVAQDFSEKKCT